MSVFVAAIVKGLIEQSDGTVHFGSLMGYKQHLSAAINAGVVTEGQNGLMVTPLGVQWYKSRANVRVELEPVCIMEAWKNYNLTPPSNKKL